MPVYFSIFLFLRARFDLDEEWQKQLVFKSMGSLWRASKSRLVHKILEEKNEEERLQLQPNSVHSRAEWRKFVKEKTSPEFKVIIEGDLTLFFNPIGYICEKLLLCLDVTR